MKNIAEELGFPKALVSLRHQAVHQCRDGSLHSRGMLKFAFNEIQRFVDEQYWQPIRGKLLKREATQEDFKSKLQTYRVVYDQKYKLPPFSEMQNSEQRNDILKKFTKANLPLSKQLDGTQIVEILDHFV